ncbi:hypothetical protein N7474_005296 [Penicillium riverlandense]|uniref:uncharacterized protein n=1 Tax=Penicillium riverlandense TaxID=1903569 RepID=UPI002546BC33|nr:uncharacterized protein N7474_005296 [Penicillium riverlandense]KAJ5819705.1 hypothetical protein N7474_005296 [Penicillium riverlandense]
MLFGALSGRDCFANLPGKSCMRCVTAKRTCGGYENDEKVVIQQYERPENKTGSTTKSIGRKCSLPVRGHLPGTNILANDNSPIEVPDEAVDEFALQAFVYDFCVSSTNQALSRGFLGRLESRLHRLGWKSNLAKACELVAFAKHGISLNRPHLTLRAEKLYQNLVASLAVDIQHPPNKEDKVLVALLLGLYEVRNICRYM